VAAILVDGEERTVVVLLHLEREHGHLMSPDPVHDGVPDATIECAPV